MSPVVVGTVVTAPVSGGDKFRVTWTFYGASVLPALLFAPVPTAENVRNWLPSVGFIPVSSPSALPGDEAIVFDVRAAQNTSGRTVAQAITLLDSVPAALHVTRLEYINPLTISSATELEQAQDYARKEGNAAAGDLLSSAGAAVGTLISKIGTVAGIAAIVVIVAGMAYIVSKRRN